MQPNPKQIEEITVEEIDATLHHIASACKFSSNKVRAARDNDGHGGVIYPTTQTRDQ